MSEQLYPTSCRSCGKPHYGPVNYCPYCAVVGGEASVSGEIRIAAEKNTAIPLPESDSSEPSSMEQDTHVVIEKEEMINTAPGDSVKPSPVIHGEVKCGNPDISSPEITAGLTIEDQEEKSEISRKTVQVISPVIPPFELTLHSEKWKWIAVVIFLLVLFVVGYKMFFVPSRQQELGSAQESGKPGSGRRDSARVLARETLNQGTDLSVAISSLQKLEKVREAAQNLAEISPRYQEQLTTAEKRISVASNNRDKSMMTYIGKVVELGSYSQDEISYALGIVQKGDLTSREKVVFELLTENLNSIRNNTKMNPQKMHTSFTKRFNDFVD